jgi:hypothetical protein
MDIGSLVMFLPAIPLFILPYKVSGRGYCFINKWLLGKQIIECEGTSIAITGDKWRSPIYVNEKSGEIFAYRYPEGHIGKVRLRANGTGDYCGELKWRFV